ncbi:hypothetical protein F4604DRAFT_1753881 [Suillus subluteus]|nr:hypothetical protein F4604DRAFT_1753881 [Suillus subluteus]
MAESQSTTLSPTEVQSVELQDTDTQTHVSSSKSSNEPIKLDIEHAVVENDPRIWSNAKKNVVLVIISGASMIAGLCANIQNRELFP